MTIHKIVTIGVYGFEEDAFFNALQSAGVEVFCDIRRRRGVRGSDYAFVNSQRLQAKLAQLGIRYVHWLALAPSQQIRDQLKQRDLEQKIAKRQREVLDEQFVEAYQSECLSSVDAQALLSDLVPQPKVIALFCVEREPTACHRLWAAESLARSWNIESIEHITP
jgi:uncharacterized protein (DUF488 family)